MTGPAGTYIMSVFRLGWTILSAFEVVIEKGHLSDLRRYAPGSVREVGKVASDTWAWSRLLRGDERANALRKGVWTEPIREVL